MPKSRPDFPNEVNSDTNMHSFVVRVWREEATPEERETIWRGHITPIPNGKRHYFTNISEIPDLIVAHLKSLR